MSEYMVCDTQLEDWDVILEALGDLGITEDMIEQHKDPVELKGFYGNKKASIVVRAWNAGSIRDIGFERSENGHYKALVYDMDRSGLAEKIRNGRLRQCYAKRKSIKTVRQVYRRSKIKSCEEDADGKIRIRLRLN